VGGCTSGNCYTTYTPFVNSHLSSVSPLEITATYVQAGLDVDLYVNIEVTGLVTATNNRVHFVVCEDGGHSGKPNLARQALTYEPFTLTAPGQTVDITRSTTLSSSWTGPINIIVFVQSHTGTKSVLQATLATEEWVGPTMDVRLACVPESGTLPFNTSMWVTFTNETPFNRRLSGRVNVQIATGSTISNWRGGYTNLSPDQEYVTNWVQYLPGLGSLVGTNTFTLEGWDVTPSPFNQPPYPAAGDSASDVCTITAYAP